MNSPSLNMPHADRLYVGGRWVAPTSAKTFAVLNCATEDVVAHAAMANEADVDAAVHAARTAFDRGPWPHLSPAERAVFLEKIAARLEALNDDFARGWSIESGVLYRIAKPRIGLFLSGAFRQYAAMAHSYPFVAPARASPGTRPTSCRSRSAW